MRLLHGMGRSPTLDRIGTGGALPDPSSRRTTFQRVFLYIFYFSSGLFLCIFYFFSGRFYVFFIFSAGVFYVFFIFPAGGFM